MVHADVCVARREMHDSTLADIEVEGDDAVLLFASLAGTLAWKDHCARASTSPHLNSSHAMAARSSRCEHVR